MQRGRIFSAYQTNDPSHKWALENGADVKSRTRYCNVQAWANSRIHLKVPDGQCDYINASPIVLDHLDDEQGAARYIATQVSLYSSVSCFFFFYVYAVLTGRPFPPL